LFRPILMAGTWVAVWLMPGQRRHSRAYLAVVLGRPAHLVEIWRHFFGFTESLLHLFRAGRGASVTCVLDPDNEAEFEALLASRQPAIFGTFHFGGSDLLGYLLGERGRRVSILRQRVGQADYARQLGERFGRQVSFLWVNDPARVLFDLKAALEAGDSLALKCDRLEFSARAEPFQFLGARRLFPFTIYHLALLFDRPVVFCTAVAAGSSLRVVASPVFHAASGSSREANTQAARRHFQAVLVQLEALVRRHPYLWFNFRPLNAGAPST
jgi:predicted LPLAT superfamily acyltransferase